MREMGVQVPPRTKYERKLTPRNKFRAGVFTVIAAMRLSDMQEQWCEWKTVGEKLKVASSDAAARAAKDKDKLRSAADKAQTNEARKVRQREL